MWFSGEKSVKNRADSKCRGPEAEVPGVLEKEQGAPQVWNRVREGEWQEMRYRDGLGHLGSRSPL